MSYKFFLISIFFQFTLLSQNDTLKLSYSSKSPFNGGDYMKAVVNNSYVQSIDENGNIRVEGKLYGDCGFQGKAIYYYSDGKIERIEFYTLFDSKQCPKKSGLWQYFDQKGNLIKEINFD